MAHPMKKAGVDAHNAKLRAMTRDYGSAGGKSSNIASPTSRYTQEGPEDSQGFGTTMSEPKQGASKPSRKQLVANPVATLKTGGRALERARGGRAKKKGGTHVNVIIGHPGAGAGPNPVPPVVAPAGAPMGGAPPMPPPRPPTAPPMAAGAPGGVPPGMIPPRKSGGKVLFKKMLKAHHSERASGGKVDDAGAQGLRPPEAQPQPTVRHKHHLTAGSLSGLGRLEKIGKKTKPHGGGPIQAV